MSPIYIRSQYNDNLPYLTPHSHIPNENLCILRESITSYRTFYVQATEGGALHYPAYAALGFQSDFVQHGGGVRFVYLRPEAR